MTPVVVGLLASAAIAAIAWRVRALTAGGALGAVVVGTIVYALGGVGAAVVLVGFFASSSALSRWGNDLGAGVVAKGGTRDISQVLANGLVPAVMLVGMVFLPAAVDLWPAYVGAVGAATADTWSTEIGMRSKGSPHSILWGRVVAPGTSGGVTPFGLAGALAGGLAIGALGAVVALLDPGVHGLPATTTLVAGTFAGLAGAIGDSLLGATLQRVNWCPVWGVETEQTIHRCGTPTVYQRGLHWLDNDWVNLLATVIGALAGLLVGAISWYA